MQLAFAYTPSRLVKFKVHGIDGIQVLPGKQGTDDIYHNFAFSYPSDEVSELIVPNGIGTFMNISYANLFLRLTIDHSFVFLVSDFCKNCNKNILLNVSHSLTGDVYSFESSECWSNSFISNQYSMPQCEIKLDYGDSSLMGVLGYDTIYLTAYSKSFALPNIIYLSSQDNQLVNSDLNGMMGLGTPDADGAYGISVLEELLGNSVMETPVFSLCLTPTGSGYLYFSAYGNASYPFDKDTVTWFEQAYSYMYTLDANKISFLDKEYGLGGKHIQFTLNTPYLLLPQDIFSDYAQRLESFLCRSGSEYKILCDNLKSLMIEEDSLKIGLADANILKELPTIDIHLRGKGNKKKTLSIQKLFAICPENSRQYFAAKDNEEIAICSMIRLNKNNPDKILLGNIASTEEGNMFIFDRARGLLGLTQEVLCYRDSPNQLIGVENMVILKLPVTYSLIGQIFIILGFCTLLVLSLNKCDEYFYQEEEGENEEGVSLNFLTNNQTRSDITNQDISNMR